MSNILLIEPDHVLASNLRLALERAGHQLSWAVDAQTAISQADADTPSLVISDLFLAGRSGIEFLYEFRSYPEWQQVPVILLSSLPEGEVNLQSSGFLQLGIAKYFYKPQATLAQIVGAAQLALAG